MASTLTHELWVIVATRLTTYAEVARSFAPVCREFRAAGRDAELSFLPRVAEDGTVMEPRSGFFIRVSPGSDLGTVLLEAGDHLQAGVGLLISREIHVFGRDAARVVNGWFLAHEHGTVGG